MVVAPRRDERSFAAIALDQLEAENAAIKAERPLDIGDLEVDMPDAGLGGDRFCCLRHFSALNVTLDVAI